MLQLMESIQAKSEISMGLGHSSISGELNKRVRSLLSRGLIEYTLPDKPQSRLQKYRLTERGREWLRSVDGPRGRSE